MFVCSDNFYSLITHAGQESQGYQPEELNKKALEITHRVKQKLTGIFLTYRAESTPIRVHVQCIIVLYYWIDL